VVPEGGRTMCQAAAGANRSNSVEEAEGIDRIAVDGSCGRDRAVYRIPSLGNGCGHCYHRRRHLDGNCRPL
jgi:hypothetical protein